MALAFASFVFLPHSAQRQRRRRLRARSPVRPPGSAAASRQLAGCIVLNVHISSRITSTLASTLASVLTIAPRSSLSSGFVMCLAAALSDTRSRSSIS